MDEQDDLNSLSVIETLNRLCATVETQPDVVAICNEFRTQLAKYCPCKAVVLLTYSSKPRELHKIACTPDVQENDKIKIDDSSSSWIELSKPDSLHIFDDSNGAPLFIRDLAEKIDASSAAIFVRGEMAARRTILAVLAQKDDDISCWEKSEYLTQLLRGSAILLEYCRKITDLNNYIRDYESLFDLIPIAILLVDENGIVLSANKEVEVIFGFGDPDRSIVGENLLREELFKKGGISPLVRRAISGDDVETESIKFRSADGVTRYLYVNLRSILDSQGKRQALGVITDISARIHLQQQLERSYQTLTEAFHELQRVDKMKSQFIDVVSHELRTPLTVIRGYLDMITKSSDKPLDPKVAQKLGIICQNTDRLHEIVESMLDITRIEKGSMEVVKQEASLRAILEEIMASLRDMANDKGQELMFVKVGDVAPIKIDSKKIRDALRHIINNAIKYTPENGKIQVTLVDEGNMAHMIVKDNGIGIPLSELTKIFERFYIVAADELSHQVDRLGLGLPIAKGIIESHGGKIWVESEVGKGTIFHIQIPKG